MFDLKISHDQARAFALHVYRDIANYCHANPDICEDWERELLGSKTNDEPIEKKIPALSRSAGIKQNTPKRERGVYCNERTNQL